MTAGHVFVIHGRLESIDADVVVVPTDEYFSVKPRWWPVFGLNRRVAPTKPAGWGRGSTARSPENPDSRTVWFIDVAVDSANPNDTIDKIVGGVIEVIEASKTSTKSETRQLPLVAIPTLGVSGGGLSKVRGELIRRLLSESRRAAELHGVDVVIVAFKRADHAAFQHLRRELDPVVNDPNLNEHARSIAAKARSGELALFVGAGVSMSAGLPSWESLLTSLQQNLKTPLEPQSGLNSLDIAELVSRESKAYRDSIVTSIGKPDRAGLSHFLLADLRCEQVVTTNFDLLYELSARAGGDRSTRVLPWDSADDRGPWILKMHGDIDHPKTIILSRSDFIKYGSSHGPAGAVLQSLLLSRHLLVVGASMTDDNFLRLAYEVREYVARSSAKARVLGTVVTHRPEPARKRLFEGVFHYVDASRGSKLPDGGRALAIFLDAVAMYATTDSSFLLDPAYRSLLGDRGRALADEIRNLYGAGCRGRRGVRRGVDSIVAGIVRIRRKGSEESERNRPTARFV